MPNTATSSPSSTSVWRPDCRPVASRLERHRRGALVLATLSALVAAPLPPALVLCWLPAWLLLAWRLLHWPDGAACCRRFRQTPTGWRLQLADGEWVTAELRGDVRDWHWLLQLTWRETDGPAGRRPRQWPLSLWCDQLPAADWRRLRVSLRWAQSGVSTVSSAVGRVSG